MRNLGTTPSGKVRLHEHKLSLFMPWWRRLRLSGCQPHPLQRGELRIAGHLLRLRHGFHLWLALPLFCPTGAALALVPVRGGDSGAWTLDTALARSMRPPTYAA